MIPSSRSSSSNKEVDLESSRSVSNAETLAGVLHEIAVKCGTKVAGTCIGIECICACYKLHKKILYILFSFPFLVGGVQASFGCQHRTAIFC